MQSRALELLVGFFVCLGIAAIFILTMRVSDVSSIGGSHGYTVQAEFFNIGNLQEGAQVNMAGVRIGRVASIHLDPNTYEAVVEMRIDDQFKLPADSSASILTSGLLGSQYVGIEPGGAADFMENGDSFVLTQGAVILEKLISQLLYSFAGNSGDAGDDSAAGDELFPPAPD
ncbi:MAG TPA: outer membrane lipid asymmetry maintenance protein MlaD [Salinisphaeraceae bacterium]|nr:outer membrane lipid asymmetry maintenance protein MlaD [Salinisphaeraceae bacterium]